MAPFSIISGSLSLIDEVTNRILREYGDRVSVERKAKSLLKFGRNQNVGSAATGYTIWYTGQDDANEAYVAANTNSIDSVGAANGSDTGVGVTIEGHTETGGKNQSEKASTSTSSEDYWIITNLRGSVLEKAAAIADVELQVRRPGGVFRPVEDIGCSDSTTGVFQFNPYFIVPPNSDVRLVAVSDSTSRDVSRSIQGCLALII